MKAEEFPRNHARAALYLCACFALVLANASSARAQTPPVLLTEGTGTTTRAVAYDAITFRSEPFVVTSPYNWNADKSNTRDQRTRVIIFARNLSLLPGEGASALTADAQDASGRLYPLKVEALTRPKYVRLQPAPDNPSVLVPTEVAQPWLYAVTLRLDDAMTDALGDVLVRVSLHGVSSNRVRMSIGQAGTGIATDPSTEFVSPAPAVEPTPLAPLTAKAYGPGEASAADIIRDRKSTRLNSSHANISYAVFCLKKKKNSGPGGAVSSSRTISTKGTNRTMQQASSRTISMVMSVIPPDLTTW